MQKLVALSAAGGLFLTKPSKESFRPFLQKWAVEVGSQNRDTSDNGGLSNFLRWANNQLEDLTLAATAGLSTIEIVDAGVCMVASAMVRSIIRYEVVFIYNKIIASIRFTSIVRQVCQCAAALIYLRR
eukprot:m.59463 g.59463  ORF g.59463 m.59463 type:complete len:128 (+) comp15699_c0_seq1:179-562(+)